MKVVLLLITVVISVARAQNATYQDADELTRYLFDDTRYNKEVRPLLNQSRKLEVNMSVTIYTLMKMVVSEQYVEIGGLVVMSWRDQLLNWEPALYNGIDVIPLPKGSFWHPEMTLSIVTRANTGTFLSARLTSSGDVTMMVSSVFALTCDIDTTYFPLDRHKCFWFAFSERYSSRDVKLNLIDVQSTQRYPNSEWTMKTKSYDISGTQMNTSKQSTDIGLDIVTLSFAVQRRGRFVMVSAICPGMLMTLLHILTSCVPVQSGERLSFSVTVLLSLAFFTIALMDDLPASSLTMPLISYLFVFFNSLNTITVIWSVFIVNIANKSDSKTIPRLFKRLWTRSRPKQTKASQTEDETKVDTLQMCFDSKQHGDVHITRLHDDANSTRQQGDANNYRQHNDDNTSKQHNDVCDLPDSDLTWGQLAKKLDMCFFWIMVILTVASNIVIWAYMYPQGLETS